MNTRRRRSALKADARDSFGGSTAQDPSEKSSELGQTRSRSSLSFVGLRASLRELRHSLPPLSSQQLTGLLLAPFLAQHAYVNRIVPASARAPIAHLSPSELDYTYVSHALARWPAITAGLYAALIGAASWHAVGGAVKVRAHVARKLGAGDAGAGASAGAAAGGPGAEAGRLEEEAGAAEQGKGGRIRGKQRGTAGRATSTSVVAGTLTGALLAALLRLAREAPTEIAGLPRSLIGRVSRLSCACCASSAVLKITAVADAHGFLPSIRARTAVRRLLRARLAVQPLAGATVNVHALCCSDMRCGEQAVRLCHWTYGRLI